MSTKEKFKGFTYQENDKYKQEAIEKYGKEVIEASIEKQKGKEQELTDGFNKIFFAFADNLVANIPAENEQNIALAKKLQDHICKYSFDCTNEIFSAIGYGYAKNEEFKKNIDQFGEGTAQYVCDAIQAYVGNI